MDLKLENKNDLVLITSKIVVTNNPFTYVKTRSIYNRKERLEQTIETIKSVRKYLSKAFIVLFDNSIFTLDEYIELYRLSDLFINITNSQELNYYTDKCITKAYGELYQTKYFLDLIKDVKFNNFFKISGRYLLNETFNYTDYDNDNNIFKKNPIVANYYYTSFYKISKKNFEKYRNTINELSEYIKVNRDFDTKDYELFMPEKLSFKQIQNLGITQNISVWKQFDKI
jgi:hypothetical protein